MKKYLLLSLLLFISIYFNTGCVGTGPEKEQKKYTETKRYKSGTIIIKDKDEYSEDSTELFDPGPSVRDVRVGPGNVKFGPDEKK